MVRLIIFLIAILQMACASNSALRASQRAGIDPDILLRAPGLVIGELSEEQTTVDDLFYLSDSMRHYLKITAKGNNPVERMNAVLADLRSRGAHFEYELNRTTSASEAFAQQRGNCVSHAAMVVAMARHLGLKAYINQAQLNAGQEISESGSGVPFRQRISHINAVVVIDDRPFIIEPGYGIYFGKYLHRLSDREARSLYLNNLAMEAMLQDDLSQAFAHIRTAIRLDLDSSVLWGGLGTIYRRMGEERLAEQTFLHALNLNPGDSVAQHNLELVRASLREEATYADAGLVRAVPGGATHRQEEIHRLRD
ncbi:transglutaminase-like domain-containing protein [Microbulbifer guangxiensis]|uniref:transglutaminase-like domain-containing protein n=1 Tax=Microbulbifer guangxiensis TaxID=2904249 RepID=UPI001F233E1A|nr:transglutaminase domain-containing protein [Microbulbifer guangxiensis]